VDERPTISDLGLNPGKKARLFRILFQHGLCNGTALFLPYDHGLEHGPRDFFANPAAVDPAHITKLAVEAGFNGIVLNIGLAETFYWDFAGEIPLILKLNGKTDIHSDDGASPLTATVADAVRLGADAVGYTLQVGSPAQAADFAQYRRVREEATRLGMPLIAWACPRGSAFEASGGGANSFYAVDYAARVASELGADMVKVKFPHPEKRAGVPAGYDDDFSPQQAMAAVVRSANRTLVLVSGGSMAGDEAMLEKARQALEAGATGLTFGRNIWQREHDESLRLISKLQEILVKHPACSIASWERRHGSFGESMIFPS